MQKKEVAAYKDEKKRVQAVQHRARQSFEEVCVCVCVCACVCVWCASDSMYAHTVP